ncbi:MAG: energy transducer TonB, partial [Polaromonas sp.]|nr:energy transducer TonB [Polaromonas sp.]
GAPLVETVPGALPAAGSVATPASQLTPPPIKYITIQIHPAAPAPASELPAVQQAPPRLEEPPPPAVPRELPAAEPAPRVISEP